MLKRINVYNTNLRKFKVSDFKRELPFAQDKDYKFIISLYDERTGAYKKMVTKRTFDDACLYYGTKIIECVLYYPESGEANIVLAGK